MPIKSFADTSAVSLSYAFSDAADAGEVVATELNLVPFTTEGFTMSKEAKTSAAISGSRRIKGSKNTKGSASGAATLEFGSSQFCLDMLQAALMNTWTDAGDGSSYIFDSDVKQYLLFEKTIRPNAGAAEKQSHERYFGTLVNDATIELGDGELITLAVNTMSANADYTEAPQGSDGMGGSIATTKVVPESYEIADASNNLENFVLRDAGGQPLELTFASASIGIENNVREQPGLGHVFSAGMGMGKVGVSVSGEVYYYDQTVLDVHMTNKRMTGEASIETEEGRFDFFFPNMVAQSPSSNAGGENQDYTTSLTLSAEEGKHEGKDCTVYIKFTPTVVLPLATIDVTMTVNGPGSTVDISGNTTNAADNTAVVVTITDSASGSLSVPGAEVISDGYGVSSVDISSLAEGDLTVTVSIDDNQGGTATATDTKNYTV